MPEVHVDWELTEQEWEEVRQALLLHVDRKAIRALYKAGKLGPYIPSPEFWPPRPGDTWVISRNPPGAQEYFCHEVSTGVFSRVLVNAKGSQYDNDDNFESFRRMRPRLVRRTQ